VAASDVVGSTAELAALQGQLDERTADLQRISAEYSNYRRRVERDRQLVMAMAKAQVAGELLPVLDDIERAQQHGDLSGAFKAVADKLVAALQAQGLEPFGAIGDGFDPDVHEAVQHSTSSDVHKPTVTAVLRLGYRFSERVLRPAMVGVTDAAVEPVPSVGADPFGDDPWGDRLADNEPFGGPTAGPEQTAE
jgi:molecular chaperone GrpE